MRSRRRASAALAVLILLTAACEPGSAPDETTPVPGGTLVVAVRDLGTLDPARASSRGALLAVSQIFDSLTAIDPTTNEVLPAAAERWRTSKDGLRWTFTIADRRYHNGKRVTAGDFKFAFDRIARKRTKSDAAFQLEPVRGFRATNTLGSAAELSGIRVAGTRTLVILLERPYAELPYALAHPSLAPLQHRVYRNRTGPLATRPIGNGPFKVVGASLSEEAELVRNDAYTPTPYLDGLRFTVQSNTDEGWRAFEVGDTDVADVPISAIASARARYGDDGFTPQWSTLSFGPNAANNKYRKPEVRRALSLAIDRRAIAETIYGNTKDPATGILPRGIRGYLPDACGACHLDRDRARQIVRAAFRGGIPTITVDHLDDDASRLVSEAVGENLQDVGFPVRLRAHTPDAYLRLLQRGRQDLAQLGWLADIPTPDGFLAQQLRTGSPNNQTGFKDVRFDRLIDIARRTMREDRRLSTYRRAEARALELMPLIPVVFFRNRTAISDRVHGFNLDGAGLFDASTIWVSS